MPIGHGHTIINRCHTKVVGGSVGSSAFDPGAGHPCAEGVLVVVTPGLAFVAIRGELGNGQSAELAAPHHQCAVEQSAVSGRSSAAIGSSVRSQAALRSVASVEWLSQMWPLM